MTSELLDGLLLLLTFMQGLCVTLFKKKILCNCLCYSSLKTAEYFVNYYWMVHAYLFFVSLGTGLVAMLENTNTFSGDRT